MSDARHQHTNLSERYEARRQYEFEAGQVPLAVPIAELPDLLEHLFGQSRAIEKCHSLLAVHHRLPTASTLHDIAACVKIMSSRGGPLSQAKCVVQE